MYWFITIFTILILIPLIALMVSWRVILSYKNNIFIVKIGGNNFQFTVFSSDKIKKGKKEKYIKIPKTSFEVVKQKGSIFKNIFKNEKHEIISILKSFGQKFDIINLNISVDFGFGDAAITGIASGFIWNGISAIVSFVKKHIDIEGKTNIAVYPNYIESCFEANCQLVFNVRLISFLGIILRARDFYKRNKSEFDKIKEIDKNG